MKKYIEVQITDEASLPLYYDHFGVTVRSGDTIDLRQTVNGCNLFFIQSLSPLDIRYKHDIGRKYEYDMKDLISPSKLNGDIDFIIVGSSPPVEQPEEQWVSVKERLPENRTYVLGHYYNGYDIFEFKHGCFFIGL